MSNPFFSRSAAFQEGGRVAGSAPTQTPNGYPTMPGYQAGQYGQQPNQYGQQATEESTALDAQVGISPRMATL